MSTGAVGDGTRHVAHVLQCVAGHRSAVARSYLVRFLTRRGCGRSHSACCPRRQARFRAGPGRYRVLLGTLLHAPRLWEVALGTLPRSSGALPGSPLLLPGRPRHVSRVVQAVTGARLAHSIFFYRRPDIGRGSARASLSQVASGKRMKASRRARGRWPAGSPEAVRIAVAGPAHSRFFPGSPA